jgi:hypothetical protein
VLGGVVAAAEVVPADEVRVVPLEVGRRHHGPAEDLARQAGRVLLDDLHDAVGVRLLRLLPVGGGDPAEGVAAIVPGTTRTCTHRMCLPAGARDGSIAVGWPTTIVGRAGSSPAAACA